MNHSRSEQNHLKPANNSESHLLSQIASSKLCTLVQGFSCYSLCYAAVYERTKTQWAYDNVFNGSLGVGYEV
jgi:hypothetical protein